MEMVIVPLGQGRRLSLSSDRAVEVVVGARSPSDSRSAPWANDEMDMVVLADLGRLDPPVRERLNPPAGVPAGSVQGDGIPDGSQEVGLAEDPNAVGAVCNMAGPVLGSNAEMATGGLGEGNRVVLTTGGAGYRMQRWLLEGWVKKKLV